MDKLDSLITLPVFFKYGLFKKKTIKLTPIVLNDFNLFDKLSKNVIDVLSFDDKKLLKKYRAYIDHFNSIGSGLSIAKVKRLSLNDSIALIDAIYKVNSKMFQASNKKTIDEQFKNSANWFDTIQKLISFGHLWSEIKQYNYSQIIGFIEVIEKNENDSDKSNLILMRASQSDEKGFKSILDSLTNTEQKNVTSSKARKPKRLNPHK
ncbi:hypothetical protein KAT92_03445 [Candidatus Babeliales bacterium]|nr:hypothetical protein [Candidatus Babeliales bacterium]